MQDGRVDLGSHSTFGGAILADQISVGPESILNVYNHFALQSTGLARGTNLAWVVPNMDDEDVPVALLPDQVSLSENYPNPFNPSTTIPFAVKDAGPVSLIVYNLRGAQVAQVASGNYEPGFYTATFKADGLSSGSYIYVLETGGQRLVKRMLLIK